MKNSITCLVVFFLLCSTACNPFNENIAGVWFYSPPDQRTKNDTLLTPTSFMHLKEGGTYTCDLGRFEYGQWRMEGDELVLTNSDGKIQRIRTEQKGKKLNLLAGNVPVASFLKYPGASGTANPFSLANNQWRMPATHSESAKEIQQRLYNHCQYWESYFTWALANKVDALDVASTPTPLKIYANGFGLKKYQDLPVAWRSYFYDSTDCRKADSLIKSIFRKRNIKWPETEVTYEKFISAFQQLQQQLK